MSHQGAGRSDGVGVGSFRGSAPGCVIPVARLGNRATAPGYCTPDSHVDARVKGGGPRSRRPGAVRRAMASTYPLTMAFTVPRASDPEAGISGLTTESDTTIRHDHQTRGSDTTIRHDGIRHEDQTRFRHDDQTRYSDTTIRHDSDTTIRHDAHARVCILKEKSGSLILGGRHLGPHSLNGSKMLVCGGEGHDESTQMRRART